jgi:Ca-activated chloride channel family protein
VNSVLAEKRSAGNTAGILMRRSVYDDYMVRHNNKLELDELIEDVIAGNIVLGFTNPFTSDTALNMLVQILLAIDPENPLSAETARRFESFQALAPPPAYTTAQMRESAVRGLVDVMVMERQAYINEASLSDFVFTPFGVRHDNPVYKFSDTSEATDEVLQMWLDFITDDESQTLATQMGFNQFDEHVSAATLNGTELYSAQALWKENRTGGRPVVAVFVADTSGSMSGRRIENLRSSLLHSMQFINDTTQVGLVTYSNKVTVELPIGQFTGQHRGQFQSAVKGMSANGGTHTYSGLIAGLDMLREHQRNAATQHIYMLFVLSDGENRGGVAEHIAAQLVVSYGFPVHAIGYSDEAGSAELERIAGWSEGFFESVCEENVIYNMRNIFQSQM